MLDLTRLLSCQGYTGLHQPCKPEWPGILPGSEIIFDNLLHLNYGDMPTDPPSIGHYGHYDLGNLHSRLLLFSIFLFNVSGKFLCQHATWPGIQWHTCAHYLLLAQKLFLAGSQPVVLVLDQKRGNRGTWQWYVGGFCGRQETQTLIWVVHRICRWLCNVQFKCSHWPLPQGYTYLLLKIYFAICIPWFISPKNWWIFFLFWSIQCGIWCITVWPQTSL